MEFPRGVTAADLIDECERNEREILTVIFAANP
jgi:hypothetical protein